MLPLKRLGIRNGSHQGPETRRGRVLADVYVISGNQSVIASDENCQNLIKLECDLCTFIFQLSLRSAFYLELHIMLWSAQRLLGLQPPLHNASLPLYPTSSAFVINILWVPTEEMKATP